MNEGQRQMALDTRSRSTWRRHTSGTRGRPPTVRVTAMPPRSASGGRPAAGVRGMWLWQYQPAASNAVG